VENTRKQSPAKDKERALPQTDEAASATVEAASARDKGELEAGTKTKQAAKTKAEKKPETKAKDGIQATTPEAARTKADPARVIEAEKAPQIKTETATLAEVTASLGQAAPMVEPAQPALVESMEGHIVELEPANSAAPEQQPWINAEAEIDSDDIQIGETPSEREKIAPEKSVPIFMAPFDAIAAESINYSKKSLENGAALVEQLLAAKSFESAIHIGSDFVQRSCTDFVAYLTKIGAMYAKLAGDPNFPHSGSNIGVIFQLVRKRSA
jgi:Phasin protein